MRFPVVTLLAAFAWHSLAVDGHAQCSDWLSGPLDDGSQPNGANSTVSASFLWNSKLVIGGHFTSIEGASVGYIAARDPVTGVWDDLAGGMGDQFFPDVLALTVYDGNLIAAGTFDSAGGVPVSNIASWDGSSWHALGGGLDGMVRALFVYNGDLIAGGEFANAGGSLAEGVARWDGSSWHPLGGGVNGAVQALGFYAGNLIVGGVIDDAGGVAVSGIASWNGSTWSSLGGGLAGYAYAFSLFNGDLVVGGLFNMAGSLSVNNVARWNGSAWSVLGSGITPLSGTATVWCLTNVGGDVYAGGDFAFAGGPAAKNIARWNGSWQAVGSGTNNGVRTITSLGNYLVAAGVFTIAGSGNANSIARWDGAYWGPFGGGSVGIVTSFAQMGSRVVAAGDFHQSALNGVAQNVVRWDGAQLRAFGSGVNGLVEALEAFHSGAFDELIAGGQFTIAGGEAASRIARWRENPITGFPPPAWQSMGSGFNNRVTAIERFNNTTYAGGEFTSSGTTVVNRIARWNETTDVWEAMGTGMNGPVFALVGYNGSLYAGGSFTTAGGISTGGLARWNGSSWSQVSGIFTGTVRALEVHDNKLVIGGLFAGVGGSPNIVQYDGVSITGVGTGGTNGAGATALRSVGSRIYVGGDFTVCGGVPAKGLAYFDGMWHDVLGGVDFPPVMALFSSRGEVHVGGLFSHAGNMPAVSTRAWARFAETGVPWIAYFPISQTHPAGTTVNLSVTVAQGYTPAYEWRKDDLPLNNGPTGNGSLITGATTGTLVIHSAQTGDTGAYKVIVSSACGSQESFAVTITIEAVVDVESQELPVTTGLQAIGPNPTAGPTTISFRLADQAHAIMRIYDVSGRLVRALDRGRLPAGTHRTVWDARTSDGHSVADGLYFVSLDVDGRSVAMKRIVVMR